MGDLHEWLQIKVLGMTSQAGQRKSGMAKVTDDDGCLMQRSSNATQRFGTVSRVHVQSSGNCGFRPHLPNDSTQAGTRDLLQLLCRAAHHLQGTKEVAAALLRSNVRSQR
jgi:hypothetical protein